MNGILLAGGSGTRLFPLTQVVNKHLLGLHGKFIIDYPIDTLKNLGCQNITIILGGNHYSQVVGYLGDGSRYGLNFNYLYQSEPKGIAHAINLAKHQMGDQNFSVCLGDNFFEEPLQWNLQAPSNHAQIMLAKHHDLTRFGVASFNQIGQITCIQEKPQQLDARTMHRAIAGCYLFTPQFFDFYRQLKPSARGEMEVADIIRCYWMDEQLSYSEVEGLWSDAGTHQSIGFLNHYLFEKENPEGSLP